MNPDLNDLWLFARMVENGGISATARALGIPKSRVSRRLAVLEETLGVQLIQRSTRRFRVTGVGERFYQHCAAMIAEAEAATAVIEQASAEPAGRVRMSMPVTLSQFVLAPLLPKFLLAFPRVRLHLIASDRRVDMYNENVDIVLRVVGHAPEEQDLVVRVLGLSQALLVAAPRLLEQHGAPASPADLERYPTLGMDFADGRHEWRLQGPDGSAEVIAYQPRLVTDDLSSLHAAAVAGIGLTNLPAHLCRVALAEGRLVQVLSDWELPCGQVQALYMPRRALATPVQALINFLLQELPEQLAAHEARGLAFPQPATEP